jgi:hypothetical protein
MQRGLEGRRVAIFAAANDDMAERRAAKVVNALEQAGARVHMLVDDGEQGDWQGAKYAALVLIGDGPEAFEKKPLLTQLIREFLVSDKPVAAFGGAIMGLFEAGGVAGRTLAAEDPLKSAIENAGAKCVNEPMHVDDTLITASSKADVDDFAKRVIGEFAQRLEERDVDEMSELSFPASDPPAITPSSAGHVAPDKRSEL